ncbi:PREDICTED: protein PML isoform X2 [Condylura cristata]|uniref:protein PML isoform X2 n=1 Tax=Condylura cristata TaxID=143302 RepID=UPI000643350F|nr:PREDICTED: protein PML isoform X2 [Condylura cristata]
MEPAPVGSPGPQRDPAMPHTPTKPARESPSEGHQSSPSRSPTEPATEDEFQFLYCQGCQTEAKCPKLLPCLHTLCSRCLEAQGEQCPICQAPRPPGADTRVLDNVFFECLQRRLSIYRQIVGKETFCTRCKEPADFWCFECEQLLCAKCFDAHQWYLKHEIRPLAELRSQSVHEFLEGLRKTNNIFCSNTNHRKPTLTSIYCRGCSKPLCCSCALLDDGHSKLKCDISLEIRQRQEELDAMTQALQEQDAAFGAAQAKMRSAVSQLGRLRRDTEELIRSRMGQVVEHVLAQEHKLLKVVNERYQCNYEQLSGQLRRLDVVLQRIRTGSALVQKMKSYASDQEVLDMHSFLLEALTSLRQEQPQDLQAAVHTDTFEELKVHLQDLVSYIIQRTDAALPKPTSPETASIAKDIDDIDMPEEIQRVLVQPPGLAEAQPVVQSVPGAHPVPLFAYSIKDASFGEEVSTPQKRKSCLTECPSSKVIKMESEEEREARLTRSSPEQPKPSTSKAISPPHLEGPPRPNSLVVGSEVLLPNSNHVTSEARETEEHIVVISSSEDSDAENSPVEPKETTEPRSSPAGPLLRAPDASLPCGNPHLPQGIWGPLAGPPIHSAEQAAIPEAECSSQQVLQRGINFWSRRKKRTAHPLGVFHKPFKLSCAHMWASPPSAVEATSSLVTTRPPNQPDNPWEYPACHRNMSQSRRGRGASRSRNLGLSSRGSSYVAEWLNNFFSLPLSVIPQPNASIIEIVREGRAPQILGAELSPGDSNRAPVEIPQSQVGGEDPPEALPPSHSP